MLKPIPRTWSSGTFIVTSFPGGNTRKEIVIGRADVQGFIHCPRHFALGYKSGTVRDWEWSRDGHNLSNGRRSSRQDGIGDRDIVRLL